MRERGEWKSQWLITLSVYFQNIVSSPKCALTVCASCVFRPRVGFLHVFLWALPDLPHCSIPLWVETV